MPQQVTANGGMTYRLSSNETGRIEFYDASQAKWCAHTIRSNAKELTVVDGLLASIDKDGKTYVETASGWHLSAADRKREEEEKKAEKARKKAEKERKNAEEYQKVAEECKKGYNKVLTKSSSSFGPMKIVKWCILPFWWLIKGLWWIVKKCLKLIIKIFTLGAFG